MSRAAVRADLLIEAIRKAGTIRTAALVEATGVTANNIGTLLAPAIAARKVTVCKVSSPVGRPSNEYRIGSGIPDTFKPLDLKRAGVALGTAAHRGGSAPAVPLSTPKKGANDIEAATLGKPQRGVGSTTPAAGSPSTPLADDPAVTAAQATPEPKTRARLKKEPAAPKAPAGDVLQAVTNDLHLSIEEDGTLLITSPEGFLELNPNHTKRLGYFIVNSQGIWNPF